MRGKARDCVVQLFGFRITPAYAGKRKDVVKEIVLIEDHPRVCGEKAGAGKQPCKVPGSPPRMRGKVRGAHHIIILAGITPAYAGKSS